MKVYLFVLLLIYPSVSLATLTITYLPGENSLDTRYQYDKALLILALEKTLATHGEYELKKSKYMNKKRALEEIEANSIENFLVKHAISHSILARFGHVNFPVDLGAASYKTFFVSPKNYSVLNNLSRLEQLKQLLLITQEGSEESKVLISQGFRVGQASSYEGLFKMVAKGRVDLFPRSVHEILAEYKTRRSNPYLLPDHSVLLFFELPRFFLTNNGNQQAIKRIQTGLEIAYKDGSLQALWSSYFLASLEFVAQSKSTVFKLENPFLKGVDKTYRQFFYNFNR